jgi:hypothetical protein
MECPLILEWEEKQRHESLNDYYFEKGLEHYFEESREITEPLTFIGFDDKMFPDIIAIKIKVNEKHGFTYFYNEEEHHGVHGWILERIH